MFPLQCPPCTESPFARRQVLPGSGAASQRRLSRRYPAFFAPMGSCAGPKPSRALGSPCYADPGRLLRAPAGRWPFPTLSPRVFPRMPGPLPRRLRKCTGLMPSFLTTAFPNYSVGRRSANSHSGTSEWGGISGLQSFTNVQASRFAATQVPLPLQLYVRRAAVAFTSEQNTFRYLRVHRIC